MDVINLIPMAGEGKRFKDAGYTTPKPLINVDKLPMVVKSLQSLPKSNKNILIVRKDQLDINNFKLIIEKYFNNILIIEIDYLTNGQASTCLLAEKYIQKNCILNVGACDIGFSYKHENYLKTLKNYNSFIWTYNNNKNVLKNPEMYGWVKTIKNSTDIEFVSCKKPFSNKLMTDPVVSGTFTFKNSDVFFKGIKDMIDKNDRVNNEFYLDNVFNHLKNKSGIFQVDDYYSWGTPNELNSYLEK